MARKFKNSNRSNRRYYFNFREPLQYTLPEVRINLYSDKPIKYRPLENIFSRKTPPSVHNASLASKPITANLAGVRIYRKICRRGHFSVLMAQWVSSLRLHAWLSFLPLIHTYICVREIRKLASARLSVPKVALRGFLLYRSLRVLERKSEWLSLAITSCAWSI